VIYAIIALRRMGVDFTSVDRFTSLCLIVMQAIFYWKRCHFYLHCVSKKGPNFETV